MDISEPSKRSRNDRAGTGNTGRVAPKLNVSERDVLVQVKRSSERRRAHPVFSHTTAGHSANTPKAECPQTAC
jgi:hypothetical protein